jgi:Tol biopolymer transport system component
VGRHPGIWIAATSALVAAAAVSGYASTASTPPDLDGALVYASGRSEEVAPGGQFTPENTDDLFVQRLADERGRRLTRTPSWEGDPEWSPDGRRIAFSTGEILCHGGDCFPVDTSIAVV